MTTTTTTQRSANTTGPPGPSTKQMSSSSTTPKKRDNTAVMNEKYGRSATTNMNSFVAVRDKVQVRRSSSPASPPKGAGFLTAIKGLFK